MAKAANDNKAPRGSWLRMEKLRCDSCSTSGSFLIKTPSGDEMCPSCAVLEICDQELSTFDAAIVLTKEHQLCAYCGEIASDVEHVYPRSSGLPTYTVLACSECNGLAGSIVFPSFRDKRDYIHAKLGVKYSHLLKIPEWDRDEIRELGPGLRDSIAYAQHARSVIRQRLRFRLEEIVGVSGAA